MTAEPAARGEIPPFVRRVLGLTTPRRFTYDGLVRVGRRPTWIYARIPLAQDRLPSGARVAPGATLYVCPYLLHRHPHHYAEPERFDPRRFAAAGRSDRFVYLPFGDGPHRCLGENLARLAGVLVLARLAQRLRFELLGPDRVEPHGGITLTPKGGLPARVELR